MAHILITEDDCLIAELLQLNLQLAGYTCTVCHDGARAIEEMDKQSFNLALLDVMVPAFDGFELFDYTKQKEIPVIYISAKTDVQSKIHGLKLGAEDYITKPFDILEVLVRIEKVLSRNQKQQERLSLASVEVHLADRRVFVTGNEVTLKPMEYNLLLLLIKHPNTIFSREQLLKEVWGDEFFGETRTVDNHIAILRKKLNWSKNIVTVHRIGYKLVEENHEIMD